jgi:hypothetical protein
MFDRLDANHDGSLTKAEFIAGHDHRPEPRWRSRTPRRPEGRMPAGRLPRGPAPPPAAIAGPMA